MDKYVSSLQAKLLYVMEIQDAKHRGCVKVGDASVEEGDPMGMAPNCKALNDAARSRIDQYTKTAAIDYRLLYTELLIFFANGKVQGLRDYQVRDVLKRSGIKQPEFAGQGNEWYCCDVQTVVNAIKAAKAGRSALNPNEIHVPERTPNGEVRLPSDKEVIEFREEQIAAINKTVKHFAGGGKKMLWNAKMRFGKTLSTLEVVRRLDYHRTLIITHRPVVDDEWFGEFKKIFTPPTNYRYGSRKNGEKFQVLEQDAQQHANQHYIYFASVQDLRGSDLVGGNFEKNMALFDTPWDMLVIDEAHEGTQTILGQNVIETLKKENTHVLSLSGTPFNLLDDFEEKELFTWDYVMEQKAKAKWDIDHFGDPNPYSELPRMNIYTFELGKLLTQYEDLGDKAFNFKEFFRVENGEFVHKKDVRSFLDLIVKYDSTTNYPYSTQEFRRYFRHSLWMVPGVKEAKALSEMLQVHPIFSKFQVVNVAGEGDDDVPYEQAAEMVKKAIGDDPEATYTITLSCGRLTTGVTIKPWTAVFMLSGSYSTDAKAYMQTIFRVQSPWNYKGKQKEECYVFDFAPDRTLKVIAETAKVSTKAGKTTDDERKQMGEFLNFCPVIGYNGTCMQQYDANKMMEQLKRVYIDRVVRRGFDDVYIYSDELRKVTGDELKQFDKLKAIIGTTKAMHKTDSVDMAKNGLTDEEYAEKERLEKKPKRQRTPEEQARLEELKTERDQKNALISILRGISIRIPLLIYGAELKEGEEITMETLPNLVDDVSWEEFMPKGVTKDVYRQFVKFYDEDVIRSAARQIRDTTRAADMMSPTERVQRIALIFSHFHNPDKETVLTPWRVVNMHIADCMGGYKFFADDNETELNEPLLIDRGEVTQSVFADPDTHILEINSKTGLYPLYMAYTTYRFARQRFIDKHMLARDLTREEEQEIWDEVISRNIFVICKTKMARSITRRTLIGFRQSKVNLHAFDDLLNQVKNNKESFVKNITRPKFWNIKNSNNMLKFNAVVGNPPYQLTVAQKDTENGQKRVSSIFHLFQILADQVGRYTSLIYPGIRWIHRSGKGLEQFGLQQINDTHLSKLYFYPNANEIFDKVSIADGITIVLKDMSKSEKGFEYIYSENGVKQSVQMSNPGNDLMPLDPNDGHIVSSINRVVANMGFSYLNKSVLSQKLFAIESDFVETNPTLVRPYTKESHFDPSFEIKLLTNDKSGKSGRAKWYIANRNVIKAGIGYLDKWKVVVSSANAGGQKRSNQLEVLDNHSAFGRVKVALKTFDTEKEARNFYKYVDSELIRFAFLLTDEALTSLAKQVPDIGNYKDNNGYINFSGDVNAQLYKLFGITIQEQKHIKSILAKRGHK